VKPFPHSSLLKHRTCSNNIDSHVFDSRQNEILHSFCSCKSVLLSQIQVNIYLFTIFLSAALRRLAFGIFKIKAKVVRTKRPERLRSSLQRATTFFLVHLVILIYAT
jgi:hypothetical protein